MDPLRYDTELASSEYLQAILPELRVAIDAEDADRLVQLIEDSRTEAGEQTVYAILAHLLQLARNPLTEGASSACIEVALQRYQTNHVSPETLKSWDRWSSQSD